MKDHDEKSWMPGIIKTIASENKSMNEVRLEIERHKNFMKDNNLFLAKRENQTKNRIKEIVENKIKEELWSESVEKSLNSTVEKVILGNLSPYHIAEEIIENFIGKKEIK
jgi:LAO/AO transport system kinase